MKVAACVIVRNEERAVAEWIAFHIVVGFDTLLVFDNCSTDRTADVVRGLGAMYDVRLVSWPEQGPRWQVGAYDEALLRFGAEFDWIAFLDSDEFFLPLGDASLRSVLKAAAGARAIATPWMMFGSCRHDVRPAQLVIEAYRWRSDIAFGPNRHAKSIVKPQAVSAALNPHCFSLKGEAEGSSAGYVDPSGAPISWADGRPGLLETMPPPVGARINHYFVKSRSDWEAKVARGYNGTDARAIADFEAYDQNVVEDDTADLYLTGVKQILRRANLHLFRTLAFE